MDVQQTAGVIPACRGSAYSPTYTPPCSRSTPHRLVSPPPPLQEHNDTLLTVLLATLFVLGINPAPLVRVLDRAAGHLLGVPVQADGHGHAEPPAHP